MPPFAVVTLAFDPVVRLGDLAVRLETLVLAASIVAVLLVAARVARSVPADPALDGSLADGERPRRDEHLRRDDLLFVVLGTLPGAVIAGRLGYALVHPDYYAAHPGAVLDPGSGGLQLSLAVVGGLITGSAIAALLETPAGRWLHAATFPVLLGLAFGKAAALFGGTGQGVPTDLPWATAFAGAGPWGSLGPDIPSHPAQAYEALMTLGVLIVVLVLDGIGIFRARDGRSFFTALALWAIGRFVIASTWRDPAVVGPLRADQLVSIAVLVIAVLGVAAAPRLLGRSVASAAPADLEGLPAWPDPTARPRF
jgi:phosphatidylglycerol---prolipoprotein diacylglyceryl transferase